MLHAELDYDDGSMIYDVEFYYGSIEYEYEIDAANGTMIQYEMENTRNENSQREDLYAQMQHNSSFISEEEAVAIALRHSGIRPDSAPEIELDNDGGEYFYELEFEAGRHSYEYEIDALSGEILSWETDD
jgi:uncharacterized membrane protein YkoI